MEIPENSILLSFDVTSLRTNVPIAKTLERCTTTSRENEDLTSSCKRILGTPQIMLTK